MTPSHINFVVFEASNSTNSTLAEDLSYESTNSTLKESRKTSSFTDLNLEEPQESNSLNHWWTVDKRTPNSPIENASENTFATTTSIPALKLIQRFFHHEESSDIVHEDSFPVKVSFYESDVNDNATGENNTTEESILASPFLVNTINQRDFALQSPFLIDSNYNGGVTTAENDVDFINDEQEYEERRLSLYLSSLETNTNAKDDIKKSLVAEISKLLIGSTATTDTNNIKEADENEDRILSKIHHLLARNPEKESMSESETINHKDHYQLGLIIIAWQKT